MDNIGFQRCDFGNIKLQACKIPNVIGAVGGTMIPIIAQNEDEHVYVCRKGYHAINVQAVVDSNMRFLDVVAKWPGSQHDAFIFDNCGLKEYLEGNNIGHLLGDSGYPLRGYLMTPLLNPQSPAEIMYNNCHITGRQVIEKAFGILKSRFRCLHKSGGCLLVTPEKACRIVTACMRLHNYCMARRVVLPESDLLVDSTDMPVPVQNALQCDRSGRDKQRQIVQLFERFI